MPRAHPQQQVKHGRRQGAYLQNTFNWLVAWGSPVPRIQHTSIPAQKLNHMFWGCIHVWEQCILNEWYQLCSVAIRVYDLYVCMRSLQSMRGQGFLKCMYDLCVCMYVCMHACMCVCMISVWSYISKYACIFGFMYDLYVCMYVLYVCMICTYVCCVCNWYDLYDDTMICMYVCMYDLYACMHVKAMFVCMYVCMYVCIYHNVCVYNTVYMYII